MSKKDFIALADVVRNIEVFVAQGHSVELTAKYVKVSLANFCATQNPRFMRDRWLAYIAGECGPNGGSVNPSRGERLPRMTMFDDYTLEQLYKLEAQL